MKTNSFSLAALLRIVFLLVMHFVGIGAAQAAPDCIESGAPVCVRTGVTGVCLAYKKAFNCKSALLPAQIVPGQITALTASYTITRDDVVNSSACQTIISDSSCTKVGRTCKGTLNETRLVNGVNVTRDCWEWEDTFSCVTAVGANSCQALVAHGCTKTVGPVCVKNSLTGQCLEEKNTFVCAGAPLSPVPSDVVLITSTFTTVTATTVTSAQCTALAADPNCQKSGQTCVEAAGSRIINGVSVYRDCWRYEDSYSCSTPLAANFCSPLASAGCRQVAGPTCILPGPNGTCAQENYDYQCSALPISPPPTNVTVITTTVVVGTDTFTNTCDALQTNPNCAKVGEPVCVEGAGTRTIAGLPVYRNCWRTDQRYQCANADNQVSDCAQFADNQKCSLKTTTCIETLAGGQCGEVEKVYSCEVKPAENVETQVCQNMQCDATGACVVSEDQPDNDFGQSVAGMELTRQIGVYSGTDGRIFSGEDSRCSKGKLGLVNCCKAKGGAKSNSELASSIFSGALSLGKEVLDVGSMYMFDSLSSSSTMQQGMGAMISQVNNWFSGSPDYEFLNGNFDPSFSYMGFNVSFGAAGGSAGNAFTWGAEQLLGPGNFISTGTIQLGSASGFNLTFNPYVLLATLVLDWLLSCEQSDAITGLRKKQNLCHHVGTYCATKFLGACLEKKETHCCYNSRLARIVQQQGRPQIAKSWGEPKAPQCGGFTADEIANIDFSKMDLSEFVQEIAQRTPNISHGSNRAVNAVTGRVQNYFSTPQAGEGGLYLPGNATGNTHRTQTGNAPSRQGTPP